MLPDALEGEFDWFAVDRDGHIAHFSTAGYGPVPVVVKEHFGDHVKLKEHFLKSRGKGSADLLNHDGNREDWLNMARHGIYSFDFKHWEGPYILIAKPSAPIKIQDFPEEIRVVIKRVRFNAVCFKMIEDLQVQDQTK
jgi:hypothetical protein